MKKLFLIALFAASAGAVHAAPQTEATAADQLAGEPAGDRADDEEDQQTFEGHGGAPKFGLVAAPSKAPSASA